MIERTKRNPLRFAGAIALSLAVAFGTAAPATAFAAPTAADKQAEAQSVLASLNAMQDELNKASDDYFTAQQEQQQARDKMDEAQGRIEEANDEIADLQDRLGDRARSMYRNGSLSFLDLLLGATTFQQFATSWDLLLQLNQNDADLVQRMKDLRSEVETQKAEYAEQERIAADRAEEARLVKEEAEETMAAMQATYDGLSAEAAELLEAERAAQIAADAAAAQQVVDDSASSAPTGNAGGSTGGSAESGNSGGGSSSGGWSGPSYSPVTGNAIVDRAYGCLGAPYGWGAVGPDSFDCSGLVSYCVTGSFSRLGTTYTFMGYPQVSDPQPGDICVNSGHCGIYIGGGQMIHAADYGIGVVTGPVQGGMIIVRPY